MTRERIGSQNLSTHLSQTIDARFPALVERRAVGLEAWLESGSNELLQQMDKSADVSRSREALDWTRSAGIRSKGLFMLGYPGESADTIAQTQNFLRETPLPAQEV